MRVEIYTTAGCAQCEQAKSLLKIHNVPFTQHVLGEDVTIDQLKSLYPNVKSLPVILVDNLLLSGYSELREQIKNMDGAGKSLLLEADVSDI